jgi:RimJ/RimL family protein N-acetyltransferase
MSTPTQSIPNATIEAIARSLFKETIQYGFKQVDYLRFVNVLLDMSMKNSSYPGKNEENCDDHNQKQSSALPLLGERIKIRKFMEDADRQLFEKWIDDTEGRHFLISRITAKETKIDQCIRNEDNVLGLICLNNTDETPIGILAFLDHDKIQRKAELRKLIGEPEYRGKGFAKEATKLWIQFGISALELKKIYLNTLDTNIRNIKLNEELGFRVEGILRNEFFFNNEYYDVLKMSYLVE